MFCSKMRVLVGMTTLVAIAMCVSNASADIVASHAGPTTFDGIDDYVDLGNVSIGMEGSVDIEFKPVVGSGKSDVWWLGGAGGDIDYQLYLPSDHSVVGFNIWNNPGSGQKFLGKAEVPINDGEWNTARITWKEGESSTLTVNGVTESFDPAYPLYSFTSEHHEIGRIYWPWAQHWFAGEIRNVVVRDVAPEPMSSIMLFLGLVGLLAYAWRKRK